jgi:ABC-2 type transport system ATP-binding protein/lipopolysaccharide transport system ATP-binding protein
MAQIQLSNVSLHLPIYDMNGRSLKKKLLRLGRSSAIADQSHGVIVVQALNEINLVMNDGDRVGLIGHNGAGKSSLLRLLGGIYFPSSGTINRIGRCVSLLDISLGMDDNSTGYQNIRLRGLLLGMSEEEIRSKQDEIAAFTELDDYLDLPIRTYSSGMRMRLAFAVSTAVDADILLLDEVMGVGDAHFREKASRRLTDLHGRSKIVVLAIHDPAVIRETCNKAIWLDKGRLRAFGDVEQVLEAYQATN